MTSARDTEQAARVMLRPIASPLPLGFLGLGGATVTLASQQLGWVPAAQSHLVAVGVLVVAVPLQALACVMGFLARDPVVTTGMGVLAATWAVTGLLTLAVPPGSRTPVLGVALLYLAVAVVVAAALATLSKGLVTVVLVLTAVRVAVTGVYELVGGTGWMRAAGVIGVALAVVAVTAASAFGIEDARRVRLAATLRRGPGREGLEGTGLATVGPVTRDAGVRDQL